ncbi:MAG TPA: PD-(D/E)XK nuclease family protein [Candidatus Scybalousia intestinigallinarum]|nr:PD-(D/E)XK nuclease family protein [Candidatus Scybalousia intestinigallinarum]
MEKGNLNNYFEQLLAFKWLTEYHTRENYMKLLGVSRWELAHSNFLKWLFLNEDLLALKKLLASLQKKILENSIYSKHYYPFVSIQIDHANISRINVIREKMYHIDLFIPLQINDENFVIVLENKVESFVHGNQLQEYLKNVQKLNITREHILPVYLCVSDEQITKEVEENLYVAMTYQDLYDDVLKKILQNSHSEVSFIINEYIHSLSCYTPGVSYSTMIITDEEKYYLKELFSDEKMKKLVEEVSLQHRNDYSFFYYGENKMLLDIFFAKYEKILASENNQSLLREQLKKILSMKKRKYYLTINYNTIECDSIKQLLVKIIEYLYLEQNCSLDQLEVYFNRLYVNPLFITEENWQNISLGQRKWYDLVNLFNGMKLYVFASWLSSDYPELKENIERSILELANYGISLY